MKKLSVAILGLAGFAFAGMAAAACPTSASPPWTTVDTLQGAVDLVAGGYAGTECRMDASITGNLGSARAFVGDDTPDNEQRYRAQFMINISDLAGLNSTQSVRVFAAQTSAPANGVPEVVRMFVYGNATGSTQILSIGAACATNQFYFCTTTVPLTGAVAGVHTIEIDYNRGATGSVKVWVNNFNEATATAEIPVNNADWGGVDSAVLGLTGAAPGYRAAHLNKKVGFDQFDSRRTTFIGN